MKLAVVLLGLVLAGCASHHAVVATTPRSVMVQGTALNSSDEQKAFNLAEIECQKLNRHAALIKTGGTKLEAFWNFDCVQ